LSSSYSEKILKIHGCTVAAGAAFIIRGAQKKRRVIAFLVVVTIILKRLNAR
jgi:hypothetical protein